ncbi:hypothetical protein Ancab_002482 [Ancistrocladus abbreviatus]
MGGSGLYLVVDENEQFREDNFVKLQGTFIKQKVANGSAKGMGAKASGRVAKGGSAGSGGSDIYKIVKFAMGLNMLVKTVVFMSVKKWDGDSHRYIGSGEYIQMEMNALRAMVLGKSAPLVGTFRLSYYSILNLMCRAEGQFTAEHVIRNSSHQFQYEKALPDTGRKIERLEQEAALLDFSG